MTYALTRADEYAILSGTQLFAGLPSQIPMQALEYPDVSRRAFPKGAAIYTPQSFERSLAVLCTGSLQVTKGDLIMSILSPGDLFGAAALFNDEPDYATTLTARTPCSVLFFPQQLISRLMTEHPVLAERYIRYLSGRIRFLSDRVEGLTAGSSQQKLGQYLLKQLDGDRVVLQGSATVLARHLHVSRASLYRAFDALERSGAIHRDGKTIRILDPALLS